MDQSEENKVKQTAVDDTEQNIEKYTPLANDIDISEDQTGVLWKRILREGEGTDYPLVADTVTVHYVGTLLNETKFDSSRDRGEKFQFELGQGKVIKGWDIGIATMKKGELARLICTPDVAYGEHGSPPTIPPNATLIFEVELFEWKGTDISPGKDESILKSSLVKGDYSKPNEGATVEVKLIGKYEDRVFDEREVSFAQGEGSEKDVIEGIDLAVLNLGKGETARLKIAPKYAFGSVGNPTFNIPAGATVVYDVTMKAFEKVKATWELNFDEKIETAEIIKKKGTEKYKLGRFKAACKNYRKMTDYLDQETGLKDEEFAKRDALLLSAHLNTALCELKLNNDFEAEKACESALKVDPENEKAYFRRGTARLNLQKYEEALEDFNKVIKISPENKAAKNQITLVLNKMKVQKDKEKKMYSNMFSKFAKIDSEKKPEKVENKAEEAVTESDKA